MCPLGAFAAKPRWPYRMEPARPADPERKKEVGAIDLQCVNHTGHFGRYIVDWSTLDMDDIERIEIIGGLVSPIANRCPRTSRYLSDCFHYFF